MNVAQPTLPAAVDACYDELGLDPRTVGIEITHQARADGGWDATLPLDDLLVLLDLALNRPGRAAA